MKLPNVVILISGNGSNLQAIIDQCHNRTLNIAGVISNNPCAHGITRAEESGIPTRYILYINDMPREDFCDHVIRVVREFQPDLVVLAGFMKILTPNFVNAFPVVNIHPSLLPKYKGLHTHKRVLEAGDDQHGITIHWVNEELDAGEIICQKSFDIGPDDNEETIEQRVHELEHIWYPKTIEKILKDS